MDQLRPEDFRRLWPHALAAAMREAGEVAQELRQVSDRVEVSTQQTLTLLQQLPALVTAIQSTLRRGSEREVERFAACVREELVAVHRLMEALDARIQLADERSEDALARQRAVDRDRVAHERREIGLAKRERRLADERAAFASLPLWDRISAGRQWSWWRLRFLPR